MFCHLVLRGVPDQRLGSSFECPRCRNCFTLAPTTNPLAETLPTTVLISKDAARPTISVGDTQAEHPPSGERNHRGDPVRRPPPREKVAEEEPVPAAPSRSPDYPGLVSFVLSCIAFFSAALLHTSLLTLVLGLVGLALGVLGLALAGAKQGGRLLPASGLALSLAVVLVVVVQPGWLDLPPLWHEPAPEVYRGPAVLSLSGKEVFRRPAEGETLHVDASRDALHYDDVRLRVRSAVVGLANFEPRLGQNPPRERCLVIGLRITNAGITRKLRYSGWNDAGSEDGPSLRDGRGKSYRAKTFPLGWVVKGRAKAASIPPGKSLDDVIVFEAVPDSVDELALELPGAPVGVEGKLKLEIPKKMIAFRR
jgi:hypothetical protein